MLGFHWAFLPSSLTEWILCLTMTPSWTLAVAVATRGRGEVELPLPPRMLNRACGLCGEPVFLYSTSMVFTRSPSKVTARLVPFG
jgi:hypothetical protein